MSRYPRFDQQFLESTTERNERLRDSRLKRNTETLQKLIADLACEALADEGPDWSQEGLDNLRRRVANAVPQQLLPDYFAQYRDPPLQNS